MLRHVMSWHRLTRRFKSTTTELTLDKALIGDLYASSHTIWHSHHTPQHLLLADLKLIEAELNAIPEGSPAHAQLKTQQAHLQSILSDSDSQPQDLSDASLDDGVSGMDKKNTLASFRQLYDQNLIENVPMPLARDQSSDQWRRVYGPQRTARTAEYYRIWSDLFPSAIAHNLRQQFQTGCQRIGNLVVDYRPHTSSTSTTKPTGLKWDWDVLVDTMRDNQRWLSSRGNLIAPEDSQHVPRVFLAPDASADTTITHSENAATYTYMLIDLDTPLPSKQSMCPTPLWIQTQSEHVVEYVPPHPQKGTGFHRYVFLALRHLEPSSPSSSTISHLLNKHEFDMRAVLADLISPNDPQNMASVEVSGLTFHRAAYSPIVNDLYTSGRIRIPGPIHASQQVVPLPNACRADVGNVERDAKGWVVARKAPVFGEVLKRDWESVTKQLYRYAFQ